MPISLRSRCPDSKLNLRGGCRFRHSLLAHDHRMKPRFVRPGAVRVTSRRDRYAKIHPAMARNSAALLSPAAQKSSSDASSP